MVSGLAAHTRYLGRELRNVRGGKREKEKKRKREKEKKRKKREKREKRKREQETARIKPKSRILSIFEFGDSLKCSLPSSSATHFSFHLSLSRFLGTCPRARLWEGAVIQKLLVGRATSSGICRVDCRLNSELTSRR